MGTDTTTEGNDTIPTPPPAGPGEECAHAATNEHGVCLGCGALECEDGSFEEPLANVRALRGIDGGKAGAKPFDPSSLFDTLGPLMTEFLPMLVQQTRDQIENAKKAREAQAQIDELNARAAERIVEIPGLKLDAQERERLHDEYMARVRREREEAIWLAFATSALSGKARSFGHFLEGDAQARAERSTCASAARLANRMLGRWRRRYGGAQTTKGGSAYASPERAEAQGEARAVNGD